MNIVIFGAGSIGSLFGGLLSKRNNVVLIGRKSHVQAITKSNLKITGKTKLNVKISAEDSIKKINFLPELLILTVKSFDTENAIKEAKPLIGKGTIVLSLQNGLDNIDKIKKYIDHKKIIIGVTTHGALFCRPGLIKHTGKGATILGELNGKKTNRINKIVELFNRAGIETIASKNINQELWAKAIVNSSINPLSAIFDCKNGCLLENPILEKFVEKICEESTNIANMNGIKLLSKDMIEKTKEVIRKTSENYSSMYQSIEKSRETEIDSINGKLVLIGKKYNVDVSLNEALIYSVKSLTG